VFKKLLIGSLVLIVVAAAAVSAYNTGVFAQEANLVPEPVVASPVQANHGPAWQSPESPAQAIESAEVVQESVPEAAALAMQGAPANPQGGAAASQGGRGYRGGANGPGGVQGGANRGSAQQGASQAVAPEWVTFYGVVQNADATGFTLQTQAGEEVWIDSGNQYFVQNLGLVISPGQSLTVTGYWMEEMFAAGQITLEDGKVFELRDEFGRPLWAGGQH
jgi:hypothetical protein